MSTNTIECLLLGLECLLLTASKQAVLDKDGGGSVVNYMHSFQIVHELLLVTKHNQAIMVPTTPCGLNNEHLYIRRLCYKQYTCHQCFYPYICRAAWVVSSGVVHHFFLLV